jgi:N-acetylmuramoyl-L-alanine amidase
MRFIMHIDATHQLVMDAGENINFQKIAADPANFDSNPAHKLSGPEYIIMHYTGGSKMESTINTFKDPPKDPDAAASAHLLVGRDGSVVQFLRFDQIAYHTGYSWWEQQRGLNHCSIGIEIDNLGQLVRENNKWHPRHQEKIIIPDDEVQQSEYWKSPLPAGNRGDPEYASKLPGFQKFTDIQLAVVFDIVRALVKRYPSIKEILGHAQINIAQRDDPGPLLPMQAWRRELFGRDEPVIEEYILNHPTFLYKNIDGELPNTDQSMFDKPLPANSLVKVLSGNIGGLVKVRVVKGTVKGTGWVRSSSLEALPKKPKQKDDNQRKTTVTQPFFKAGDRPPTPKADDGVVFQAGTRVRIEEFRGEWALVAMLDRMNGLGDVDNDHGMGGLEGWMPREFLSRKAA